MINLLLTMIYSEDRAIWGGFSPSTRNQNLHFFDGATAKAIYYYFVTGRVFLHLRLFRPAILRRIPQEMLRLRHTLALNGRRADTERARPLPDTP